MLGTPKNLKSCISQDWDSCFLNNNLNIKNMEHFQFANHVAALCEEANFFLF